MALMQPVASTVCVTGPALRPDILELAVCGVTRGLWWSVGASHQAHSWVMRAPVSHTLLGLTHPLASSPQAGSHRHLARGLVLQRDTAGGGGPPEAGTGR